MADPTMCLPLIRSETSSDFPAIDLLLERSFADEPHSVQNEGAIVRALRRDSALSFGLVAESAGTLVGYVAVSPVTIGDGTPNWYGLGPLAVLPEHQRRGLGAALVTRAVDKLRAIAAAGLVVLGDPAYYNRFGFAPARALLLPNLPAEYFQAMLIEGDAMPSGEVTYHRALMGEC